MTTYEAFISYRRKGGQELATALNRILEEDYGISSFYDNEELHFGDFRMQLIKNNLFSRVLIVLLSPGALDRCRNKGDWVYREISLFLRLRKPVILVKYPGFTFPDYLPRPLQKLRAMPTLAFDGVSYQRFAQTIVAELRKGWVPAPKAALFEKEIASQKMRKDNSPPQQQAEKLADRLLKKKLITESERSTVQALAPFYLGTSTSPASNVAAFLCSTLHTNRLNAACDRAKRERQNISAYYGDTVQNGDRDDLCIRQWRQKAWQEFLRGLLPSLFLIPLCLPIRPGELVTFLPLVLGAPMLRFGIPKAADRNFFDSFWQKFWRFIRPMFLGLFLPFVAMAIIAACLPDQLVDAVEMVIVFWCMVYSGSAILLLLHRVLSEFLSLVNSHSRYLSRIWLHRLRLERWSSRMGLPQLLLWATFLGLCALAVFYIKKEGGI